MIDRLQPGEWVVPEELDGERLDRALTAVLPVPRSRIRRWIEGGRVRVEGRQPTKTGEVLRAGSRVDWDPPPPTDERIEPEAGTIDILHVDDDLIVVDKPAELVVHPGAGRRVGTLAHRLLSHFPELAGVGGPGRPGIVHRLDRGTSGVLVVARNAEAYTALARAFATRAVDKRYLALAWGTPTQPSGRIDAAIGRHPVDRKRMAIRKGGRPARTDFRVLESAGPVALLELTLLTGRTHQIRVHLRHFGHPLVGDPVYGEPRERALKGALAKRLGEFHRPALHARRLALAHPRTGEPLEFSAAVPADLAGLWADVSGRPFPDH